MKQVELNKNTIVIFFDYDPYTVELVKSLPGRQWHKPERYWSLPINADAEHSLKKLERHGFTVSPFVQQAISGFQHRAYALDLLRHKQDIEFASALPLRPFQRVGAAFLTDAGSALLGDEMGLGKTIQAIAAVEANKTHKTVKALVFCPAALKYQWEAELQKFVPGVAVQVVDGNTATRAKQWKTEAKYYIANYELLLRDWEAIDREWHYLIADEATRISNRQAQTSKLIKQLHARHRFALTGTPISNRPDEAWNIIDFIAPAALGHYWDFVNRYIVPDQWGGAAEYTNLDELAAKIRPYMIRRTKEQVLPELPPVTTVDVPIVFTDPERTLYDKIRKEILHEIETEAMSKLENPTTIQYGLVKLLRLRQICDSTELIGNTRASSKLEALHTIIEETGGKQVIVFTEFAEMAKIIQRECGGSTKCALIIGEVKAGERNEIVVGFNEGKITLLVMTRAGTYGLNLQAAGVVINYDQPWSMAAYQQRVGRAHRMGQKQNVLVYNLLVKRSVDEYVQKILRRKQAISDRILAEDIQGVLDY